MTEKPNPNRETLVEDADISQDSITTQVILRENGVSECRLRANDEDGANYLNTLYLKDEVVVKMIPDSNPPTAINWSTDPTVVRVFDGNVEELSPILTIKDGQVVEVVSFGKGYGLGQMRVSDTYRNYVAFPINEYVNVFVSPLSYGNWVADKDISEGFYDPNTHTLQSALHINLTAANVGSTVSAFTFNTLGENFEGATLTTAEIHIYGGLSSTATADESADIKIQYQKNTDGIWRTFTSGSGILTPFGIASQLTVTGFEGKYDPLTDYPNPPIGKDYFINALPDLSGGYINDFKIRIILQSKGGSDGGNFGIIYCYFKLVFLSSDGNTLRELITGPTNKHTNGIIPDFVNTIYPLGIVSGYSINTDYVVKEADDSGHLIPYMKFPYQDGLTSLQDIIKYGSALQFTQGGVGYHWIIDVDGFLLVAPITNHNVFGIDGSHEVSSKWNLTPQLTPIKVRQDMITQKFREEMPMANYVLVAGRFLSPFDDIWCESSSLGSDVIWKDQTKTPQWQVFNNGTWGSYNATTHQWSGNAPSGGDFGGRLYFDTTYVQVGAGSIHFRCDQNSHLDAIIECRDFPSDFTKIMGAETVPEVHIYARKGDHVGSGSLQIRLYDNSNNDPTHTYFYYQIELSNNDAWDTNEIVVKLPNIVFDPLEIGKWSKFSGSGAVSPSLKSISWIGISFDSDTFSYADIWIDGLHFEGNITRGAYDLTSISGPITIHGKSYPNGIGCRTLTIKDSVANTDRIDADSSMPLTPLALEAMYELFRHRIPRITGEIKIPLDPKWLAGQVVYIQAECTIPLDATVVTFNAIPTTTNAGTLNEYWVDSGHLGEVYQLTSISAGPVYHWTDLNVKQYRINDPYRITQVIHEFTTGMAATTLSLVNDFTNSCPIDSKSSYAILTRSLTPDSQNKTMGSLKTGGDFALGMIPILVNYPS